MKKQTFLLIVSAILFINFLPLNAQSRQIRNFDQGWKFILGDQPGAEKPGFSDKEWRTLDVPHDWSIENDFKEDIPFGNRIGYLPYGIGWYRKSINLTRKELDRTVWIEFDGVYMNSDVWINGNQLGRQPNGYISFHYKLTPYLKEGNNIIAVRVDNSQQPSSRWYNGSGIYRHVRLVVANPMHVVRNGVYITTPEIKNDYAQVAVRTKIGNKFTSKREGSLLSVITDRQGREIAREETTLSVDGGGEKDIFQNIKVTSPKLWSLESPELYVLKTFIKEKGKTVDDVSTTFGIRNIEYLADRGFLLNGIPVKMNGVNLHHEGGVVGAAVPEAVWIRRLQILKEMGCNAVRTAHNPVAPEFLDICDSLGFLVMDEVFDEWQEVKGPDNDKVTKGYHIYFDEWSIRDLTETIRRDWNHPSVVLWSVGNEVPDQVTPKGHETLKKLVDICHTEDPTRPVTQGCDRIAAEAGGAATLEFLKGLDIVGYNYVDRWRNRRELYFSIDKMAHPEWKMIGTESSAVRGVRGEYSLGSDPGKVVPNYTTGMINPEQQWRFIATNDYVIGDFMWTGIDYLGEAGWPNISSSAGAIDRCGFRKDAFYFYQSRWTEKPMIHLFPHWNWPGREGQFIPVLCYTNCEAVELFLNGRSLGEKRIEFPRQGMAVSYQQYLRPQIRPTTADLHLSWDVPYEPGLLKAVGKRKGEVVTTSEIRTSGEPYSIRLTADKKQMTSAAWDVVHVQAEIVDKDGYVVPYADNLVEFTVEGSAKLIGSDNGNPKEHASFRLPERNAFNGLCMAIVKGAGNQGSVKITARSEKLKGSSVDIKLVQ